MSYSSYIFLLSKIKTTEFFEEFSFSLFFPYTDNYSEGRKEGSQRTISHKGIDDTVMEEIKKE